MDENKIVLNYIIGEHPDNHQRIIFAFDGTGINLNIPEHKHFCDVLAKIIGTQLYAKANNINPEDIQY